MPAENTTRIARDVRIHGMVQGVGFRWAASSAARQFGVVGWVRNEPTGTVRCWVEGAPAQVAAMVRWLETGPPHGMVSSTDVQQSQPQGFRSFDIHR